MDHESLSDSGYESLASTPLSNASSEPEYPVESIRDIRFLDGINWYLVKWEGFQQETWEPEHNLDCDERVEQYFERKGNRKILPMKPNTFCQICGIRFRTPQGLASHNRAHHRM